MPLPKMPSLSVRPSWPILLPRLSWPALLLSLAGCATSSLDLAPPRADRPWTPPVDASAIVPARPDSPDARYVLPANAAGAVPQDNAIDPSHEYTLAELIDLAQSSNPRTRIAWNAARNAALATGMVKSVYLPQLAATAMTGWRHSKAPATSAWATPPATAARTAPWACSLQWLLFDFGGRQARVQAAEQATIAGNVALTAVHQQLVQEVSVAYHGYIARARAPSTRARAWSTPAPCWMPPTRATGRPGHRGRGGAGDPEPRAGPAGHRHRRQRRAGRLSGADHRHGHRRWRSRASPRCPITRCRPRWRSRSNRSSPTRWRAGPTCWLPMRPSRPNRPRRAADSDFLPKVFLSASTSHTSGRSSITAVPAIGQQAGTVNLDGSRSGSSVFLGVTLPLYDGGARRRGCRRATTPPAPANA